MPALDITEIINLLESDNRVELEFEDRKSAEDTKNNILSRLYRQRSAMKSIIPIEFKSIVSCITADLSAGVYNLSLTPTYMTPAKFICKVTKLSEDASSEATGGDNG